MVSRVGAGSQPPRSRQLSGVTNNSAASGASVGPPMGTSPSASTKTNDDTFGGTVTATTTNPDPNRIEVVPSSEGTTEKTAEVAEVAGFGRVRDDKSGISSPLSSPGSTPDHHRKHHKHRPLHARAFGDLGIRGHMLFKVLSSPLWQYPTLVLILSLYFIPAFPRLVSFVQGYLLTLFAVVFVIMWKFGKYIADEKHEKTEATKFTPPEVTRDNIEYQPPARATEEVYMNMWPQDREPYDEEAFEIKATKCVRVTMTRTMMRVDRLADKAVPVQKLYNEQLPEDIATDVEGPELSFKDINVFLSPEGLPQSRWVQRRYPIVVQIRDKAVDDPTGYYYLFARTNREKEIWFNKLYDAMAVAKGAKAKTQDDNFRTYMHNMYTDLRQGAINNDIRLLLLNKLIGRAWYNLQTSRPFNHYMRMKLTKSMRKVKVAKYFNHVGIQELKLGDRFPFVTSLQGIRQDKWGLWFEADIDYLGVAEATVRTRGIRIPSSAYIKKMSSKEAQSYRELLTAAGTPLDESTKKSGTDSAINKMIFKILGDLPIMKDQIGKRPINLHFTLKRLRGKALFNLPTPPTDRLWYGFRHPPYMDVEVTPCLGGCCKAPLKNTIKNMSDFERGILNSLMTAMQGRIKLEMEKIWVYPNMGNYVLPYFKAPPWLDTNKPPGRI